MPAPMELTRAIGIDAKCLRDKCEADHHLGYEMMKRFLPIIVGRLDETRLQILDVYGNAAASDGCGRSVHSAAVSRRPRAPGDPRHRDAGTGPGHR